MLYLEISINGRESELVQGGTFLTGVANDLYLLGRKNHPELYAELEQFNKALQKDSSAHLNYKPDMLSS